MNSKPSWRLFVILTLLTTAGCQTQMQSGSQCVVEPGTLAWERTFVWHSEQPIELNDPTGYVSPVALQLLESAVVAELGGKGFRRVERNPESDLDQPSDVEVALSFRTRRELVDVNLEADRCARQECGEDEKTNTSTRMDIRTVGFLSADVFFLGQPIWRGWVETMLYPEDRDAADVVIARAVPKLFETFPP